MADVFGDGMMRETEKGSTRKSEQQEQLPSVERQEPTTRNWPEIAAAN